MARSRRISHATSLSPQAGDPLYLWLLRLLVPLGGQRGFLSRNCFQNDDLAVALGLSKWMDSLDLDFDPNAIRTELHHLHARAEKQAAHIVYPAILLKNLDRLSDLVDLSQVDRQILAFCAFLKNDRLFDDAADWLGLLSSGKVFHVLAVLLDQPEAAIRAALSVNGTLGRTGLVSVDRRGTNLLNSKLDLLTDTFADHLMSSDDASFAALFRDVVKPAPPPTLALDHFDHIGDSLTLLLPYLARALDARRRGVNIFVYGVPGTGKTQLAQVLAREMGCELMEVSSQNGEGDSVDGERRLRAYRFTQSFFTRRRALVLFDEAEDIFNDGNLLFGRKSTAQIRKAWVNTTLEENPVPTLWLSNSVSCLDPAFARRFDMIIELPVPPRKQREQLVREACGTMLPPKTITRIAEHEHLAPAVIARAASVVGSVVDLLPADKVPLAVEHLLGSTLAAQGHSALPKSDAGPLSSLYDPAFIQADTDLAEVAAGITRLRSARLCLFGPPGTGKSAYGHWLGEQLGVSVHQRRASDLLSKYVGDTERNLAKAFREAEQDGALLLLDEVDSFLQDRRGAHRSWEVSEVNEMLTQMESYNGVLVATTNLADNLDQAALRRFDLKVKFDYLSADQSWRLLLGYCAAMGLAEPDDEVRTRFSRIDRLTPGDFAAVARQHRFRPMAYAMNLVAALEAECRIKEGGHKGRLGFI